MPTIRQHLQHAEALLAPVTVTPRFDAELLLAHSLNISRSMLLARLGESMEPSSFTHLLQRRLRHEPIAYILGTCEFYSIELLIAAPILIPRPETEHLVEVALANVQSGPMQVLDLCTGSGCVAIAIARNAGHFIVHASDINPAAINLAQKNAARNNCSITFYQGDLFDAIPQTLKFNIITANAPYVEEPEWSTLAPDITLYEDRSALVAGADGLDIIRRVIRAAPVHLAAGGILALEVGEKHLAPVSGIFLEHGYHDIQQKQDLARIPRIVFATYA